MPRIVHRRILAVRPKLGAALSLALASGLGAQEHEAHHGGTPAEEEVTSVLEATFAATERADYAALDTLYAGEDLTIVEGANLDRGWATYRDHHLRPELEQFESLLYRPRNIEVHVQGDGAWALFEYDLRIEMEGRTIDRAGQGTAIFERRDGRWVIRHMHTATRPRE